MTVNLPSLNDYDNPTEITIWGRTYPIKRIYPPHLGHDKKASRTIVYIGRKNQLQKKEDSIGWRVCTHCGKFLERGNNKKFCSKLCQGRFHKAKADEMKQYIDIVPDYLQKYMVVVDDGETWPTENISRL